METKSDNELIAEFMGVRVGIDTYSWRPGCLEPIKAEHLAYDREWGWLMPVVEKISKMPTNDSEDDDTFYPRTFGMPDADGRPMFRFNRFHLITAGTLIEAAHSAVVEFIKWYNQSNNA